MTGVPSGNDLNTITKVDLNGNRLWTRQYDFNATPLRHYSMKLLHNGNLMFIGVTPGVNFYQIIEINSDNGDIVNTHTTGVPLDPILLTFPRETSTVLTVVDKRVPGQEAIMIITPIGIYRYNYGAGTTSLIRSLPFTADEMWITRESSDNDCNVVFVTRATGNGFIHFVTNWGENMISFPCGFRVFRDDVTCIAGGNAYTVGRNANFDQVLLRYSLSPA